jgi:hypothetical protein
MEINSTSKMMQKLNGGKTSTSPKSTPLKEESEDTAEQNKKVLRYTPQPQTTAEMEQVLKNSFANTYSKDHSPME